MNENAIMDRLTRLERANRRLKLLGAACGVALVAVAWIGAERRVPAQPVTAQEFIRLVDADGQERAVLGCDKAGTFFYLNDETGAMRASIAAQKGQTYMVLKDDQRRTRAEMAFDGSGTDLRLRDETGATVAGLSRDADGTYLQLRDDAGKRRVITTTSDVTADKAPAPTR